MTPQEALEILRDENKILKLEKENMQLHIECLKRECENWRRIADSKVKEIDEAQ